MSTLNTPAVADVLKRLYADAEQNDAAARTAARAELAKLDRRPTDAERSAFFKDAYLPVAPEVGRLFYVLTMSRKPRTIVEFGTSFGISAIHFAAALRDLGGGKLIATELDEGKAMTAWENLAAAGLSDLVEIRQGDAFETLSKGLDHGIDLLLLDGWKDVYFKLIQQLEPKLNPGALILADDVTGRPEMAGYLAHVRNPANGYVSVELPIDDGLELTLRSAG